MREWDMQAAVPLWWFKALNPKLLLARSKQLNSVQLEPYPSLLVHGVVPLDCCCRFVVIDRGTVAWC